MRISIAKQHAKGRLTVRERIALLLDENTFKEIGSIAGAAEYDGDGNLVTFTHAARVIGYGRINNRMVCVEGGDFTIHGGWADPTSFVSIGWDSVQDLIKNRGLVELEYQGKKFYMRRLPVLALSLL